MKTKRTGIWLTALAALAILSGCAESAPETGNEGEDYEMVLPGKADDYYSTVAREYEVEGTVTVEMTEEEFADEQKKDELIAERVSAVGVYLTTYLTDKFRGIDINDDGEIGDDEVFFHNEGYGGFQAMVRNRSTDILDVNESEGLYEVAFTIDVAGPANLFEFLVADGAERSNGGVKFALQMPEGATGSESRAIRNFDPEAYDGELEDVRMVATALPEVSDAFPAYRDFFADGRYDITLFYGHDYNKSRSDLRGAEEAFDRLVDLGFEAPVASFDELGADSGPFVKEIRVATTPAENCSQQAMLNFVNDPATTREDLQDADVRSHAARNLLEWRAGDDGQLQTLDDREFTNDEEVLDIKWIGPVTLENLYDYTSDRCDADTGRPVRVEVRIFHSNMFEDARSYQKDVAVYELVSRDIFFYNGHAGPYYGLYLDAGYEAYIGPDEFAALPFDAGKQQIFVAHGCQTYSQYADMVYASPQKDESNLDVITTVNYSYGQGTTNLLGRLVRVDEDAFHQPTSYQDLVGGLNSEYWNDVKSVFYGVMGIDKNEKTHPYANLDALGQTCETHSDCGVNTEGNLCLPFTDGESRCTVRTVAESGCPDDANYAHLASDQTVIGGVCWKM